MAEVTPDEKLIAARLMACHKFPYFATTIFQLRPRETPGLDTFATSKNGIMRWDPAFVARLPIEQVAAVIVHEVFHLLLNHHERKKNKNADVIVIPEGEPVPLIGADGKPMLDDKGKPILQQKQHPIALWNIAGDAEINDDLIAAKLKLPKHSVTPAGFREQGIKEAADNMLAEEYYDMLIKDHKKRGGSIMPMPHPCGSCSGAPIEAEGEDETDKVGWSEAERYRVRREMAENIRKHTESNPGNIPAELLRVVDSILGPPQVPWQQELGRCMRRTIEDKLGISADYTYRRPNRRSHSMDIILPSLFYTSPHVTVVIDTSGSMDDARLVPCLLEINGILKTCHAKIDFIANDCDDEKAIKPVECKTMKEVMDNLKGGGGTDFRPAIDFLMKRKKKPDIIVYLTDGEGPAHDKGPQGVNVIWVIVENDKAPAPWGKHIFIRPNPRV